MKTFVKLFCVLMCLLMALSVFFACKKENPPDNPDETEDPTPVNPDPVVPKGDLLDDQMRAKYPGKQVAGITSPEEFLVLVEFLNNSADPQALTENMVYYLAGNLDFNEGWSPAARLRNNQFVAPNKPAQVFEGFSEFYGIFDGNGYTISGLYLANEEVYSWESVGFFGTLCGTVKNLNLENCFFYGRAYGAAKNVSIGALAGTIADDGVQIENVNVKTTHVFFESDGDVAVGGLVGSVEGDATFSSVSFVEGKVGLVGAEGVYPSPAEDAAVGQIIGDANGNTLSITDCVASAIMYGASAEEDEDLICAAGNENLTLVDCEVEQSGNESDASSDDVIEIYVLKDLISLNGMELSNKTIRLMTDITVNPEWSAYPYSGALEVPSVLWEGLSTFYGTFDGNGHTISGLCRVVDLERTPIAGGFIDLLGNGAVIKDLKIENSAIIACNASTRSLRNVEVGAFAARASGDVHFENMNADINLWIVGDVTGKFGRLLADSSKDEAWSDEAVFATGSKAEKTFDVVSAVWNKAYPSYPAGYETVIKVATASALLNLMEQAQNGETFEGKVIKLVANIDLNPGWTAAAKLSIYTNRVTFPEEPANIWKAFPDFRGILDGNGYSISGIYTWVNAISKNSGEFGGLINTARNGATIKNLVIKNSILVVNNTGDGAWGSRNIHIGGLVGRCDKTTDYKETYALTISNVYTDMDVAILCSNHSTVGGILGFAVRHGESYTSPYNLNNIVFAGRVFNTDYTLKLPFTSPKDQFSMSQIVSDTNWGSQHTITNVLAAGEIISGNTTGVSSIFGAKTYSGVKATNVITGRYEVTPRNAYNPKTNDYDASFDDTNWIYDNYLGYCIPMSVSTLIRNANEGKNLARLQKDYYVQINPNLDNIHVSKASQLISLAQSGDDFLGKTIYLDADIDFNPGWSAATQIVNDKVVFPDEPAVTWTAFANFKGRINGQGHTISGLYSHRTVENRTGDYGLLIDTQSDGSVRNLAIVNSILIVENPNGQPDHVHDLSIGGLAGNIHKTQVKSGDAGKNKYALGNSEHYGFSVGNFFTDMEVWLVSKSNALVGGLIGYVNANYTIQHMVFAGKVGNTNSMSGGSANYSATNGSNLAMGQVVGCNNWYSSAYIEDAIVCGKLVTGTTSTYIHHYVGSDDKVGYGRCTTVLSDTLPQNFAEDVKWSLVESSGYYAPNGVLAFAEQYGLGLDINDGVVVGLTLRSKKLAGDAIIPPGEGVSIVIPEGVKSIGDSAFAGRTDLDSVTLPSTLTSIGNSAFEGCTGISEIVLPNFLTTIGEKAFYGCSLTSLTLPAALTEIKKEAFKDCPISGTIVLNNNLKKIRQSAFDGCTGIVVTEIPGSVDTIEANAFRGCQITELTFGYDGSHSLAISNVAFDDTLTSITVDAKLLRSTILHSLIRKRLTSITIASDNTLYTGSFASCIALENLTFASDIETIQTGAFDGCKALTSLTIPASVTTIETGAFKNMTALTAYAVDDKNPNYTVIDGDLYTKDGTTLVAYAAGKDAETFTIPTGLTTIKTSAFSGSKVTSLTYPGTKAEWEKSGITVEENALDIPALILCTDGNTCAAHQIVIDVEAAEPTCTETGTTEGSHCSVCGEILSVAEVIPALGHDYVNGVCKRCGAIEPSALAFVSNGDGTCYVSGIGSFNKATMSIPATSGGDTVVAIGDNAFKGADFVTSVQIPDSVTSIGAHAFEGTSITSITLPTGLTKIGDFAFRETGLTSISISANVTSIGKGAFAYCSALVITASSVDGENENYMSTAKGIFSKDGKTMVFAYSSGSTYQLDKTVETIEDYAFSGASKVVSYSVQSGSDYFKATNSNIYTKDGTTLVRAKNAASNSLASTTLNVATTAFAGCDKLTSITLVATLESIGDEAFNGCAKLKTLTNNATGLKHVGTDAFKGTQIATPPTGSED